MRKAWNRLSAVVAIVAMTVAGLTALAVPAQAATATAPSAPTALTLTAGVGTLQAAWTAPAVPAGGAPVTGYKLTYSTSSSFPTGTSTTTIDVTETAKTISGLLNSTTYFVKVAAVNSVGTGTYSSAVSKATFAAPAAPGSLKATAGTRQAVLTWAAPTTTGGTAVTGYRIQYSTDSTFTSGVTTVYPGNVLTRTISGLADNTAYYFRIASINAVGIGVNSASTTMKTFNLPTIPASITLTPGLGKLVAKWTAPTSNGGAAVTGYKVQYSTDSTFASGVTTVDLGNVLTTTITGLNHATVYYARVAAINSVGTTAYSPAIWASTFTAPAAPTTLTASRAVRSTTLAWRAPSTTGGTPITGYKIQYSTDSTFATGVTTIDSLTTATKYTITGLADNTTYFYRVAAVNAAGTGPYTASTSSTTYNTPTAPTAMTAVGSAGTVKFTFTSVPATANGGTPVTGYTVEYSTDPSFTTEVRSISLSATTVSTTVTGLAPGTTYYGRAYAKNAVGSSANSNVASATTTALPQSPTNLIVTNGTTYGSFSAKWTNPTDTAGAAITATVLQYSADPTFPVGSTSTKTVTGTGTTNTVTGLASNTTYYVRAATKTAAGQSAYTANSASTKTLVQPAAPANLTATSGLGNVVVTWSPVSAPAGQTITGYTVLISTNSAMTSPTTVNVSASTLTTTFNNLAVGTTYYITVAAKTSAGLGKTAMTSTSGPLQALPAPSNFVATPSTSNNFIATWSPNTTPNTPTVTGYQLQYSANPAFTAGVTTVNLPADATSYTATGLVNAATYYVRLAAVSVQGGSPYAPVQTMYTVARPGTPAAPAAILTSLSSADLTWAAPAANGAAITGYTVTATPSTGLTITYPADPTQTGATITGLTAGTSYVFTVTATNAAGSSTSSASSPLLAATAPAAIDAPTVTIASTTGLNVLWTPPAANGATITSYTVDYSTDPAFATDVYGYITSDTTATLTGLTAGQTYYVRVKANNTAGSSPFSTASSAAPGAVPATIQSPTADIVSSTAINLAWPAPAANGRQITGYRIEYADNAAFSDKQTLTTTQTTESLTGLTAGTLYYIRIVAINDLGASTASTPITVRPAAAPSAPANLTFQSAAEATLGNQTLTWTMPDNGGLAPDYTVTVDPSTDVAITVEGTTAAITGLTPGSTYTYTVTATNMMGTSSTTTTHTAQYLPGTVSNVTAAFATDSTPASGDTGMTWLLNTLDGANLNDWSDSGHLTNGTYVFDLYTRADGTTNNGWWMADNGNYANALYVLDDMNWYLGKGYTRIDHGNVVELVSPDTNDWHERLIYVNTGADTYDAPNAAAIPLAGNAMQADIITARQYERGNVYQPGSSAWVTFRTDNTSAGWWNRNHYYQTNADMIDSVTSCPAGSTDCSVTHTRDYIEIVRYGQHWRAYKIDGPVTEFGTRALVANLDYPGAPTFDDTPATPALTLTWNAPTVTGGSPITGYTITATPSTGVVITHSGTDTTATVTGLTWGTSYIFSIVANNANGDSIAVTSNSVIVASAPDVPAAPSTSKNSADTFTASWTAPFAHGSAITGYEVRYSTDPTFATDVHTITTNETSATISELSKSAYYVQVRAINAYGTTAWSTAVTQEMRVPAAPPTITSVTVDSATQITVHFTPTTDDGGSPVTLYMASANLSDGSGRGQGVAPGETSSTITDLIPGSHYTVSMTTYTDFSWSGASSNTVDIVTPPATPGNVTLAQASATSFTATWAAPAVNGDAAITGYKLQYSTDPTFATGVTTATNALSGMTVPGLTAGTTYYVRVAAINDHGTSAYTANASLTTPTAPGSVTGLDATISDITAGTATINWAQPATGGAAITGYTINASSDNGATWSVAGTTAGTVRTFTTSALSRPATYVFRVDATNMAGTTTSSTVSNSLLIPAAPTNAYCTSSFVAGNGYATLSADTSKCFGDSNGSPITRYYVQYSTSPAFPASSTTVSIPASTSYTITGLNAGTWYYFRAAPVNAVGTGAWSTYTTVMAPVLPGAPANAPTLTTVASTAATVSWQAPASNGGLPITSYNVIYYQGYVECDYWGCWNTWYPGSQYLNVSAASTTATLTGLAPGYLYYAQVQACTAAGCGTFSPSSSTAYMTAVAPNAPVISSLIYAGSGKLTVSWTPGAAVYLPTTTYTVQYSTSSTFASGNSTVTVNAPTTSATLTGLTANTAYYVRVLANNSDGASAYSSSLSKTVLADPPTALATGTATTNSMPLTWTAPAGTITDYKVQYSTDNSTWITFAHTASATAAQTVTGLTAGTNYYFRVAATTANGTGDYSAAVSKSTVAAAPTGLTVTGKTSNSISVSWTAPAGSGITGYTLSAATPYQGSCKTYSYTNFTVAGTTATFNGAASNTTYCIQVAAVTSGGTSAYTATGQITTPLVAPTALTAGTVTATSVPLTWTAPAGTVTDYSVQYSTNNSTWTTVSRTPSTTASQTVTGLTTGTLYYFRVAAINANGTGDYTASVSKTPVDAPVAVAQTCDQLWTATQIYNIKGSGPMWTSMFSYTPTAGSLEADIVADGGKSCQIVHTNTSSWYVHVSVSKPTAAKLATLTATAAAQAGATNVSASTGADAAYYTNVGGVETLQMSDGGYWFVFTSTYDVYMPVWDVRTNLGVATT